MTLEGKPQFDPTAIADDLSSVLTALAGVTELGSGIELSLTSAEPLQSLAEGVLSRTRAMAEATLEARAEVVGLEDAAIEKARQPIERLPLENADHSTVVGTIRDPKSGETVGAGKVVAKDPDGRVIGEGVVDATGNFAIELTAIVNEVHIEALDDAGKVVSVSTVELAEDAPAAHFVEMVASGKRQPQEERGSNEIKPSSTAVEFLIEREERSSNTRRIRESVVDAARSETMRFGALDL
jgi:hypothetical protein